MTKVGYHASFLDVHRPEPHLVEELRQSMSGDPRAFPVAMAFDAVGHALYARVTSLPAYTLSRAESELLRTERAAIMEAAGRPREIVDLRCGTATQPRAILGDVQRYAAIETCRPVLDDAVDGLAAAFPSLEIRGIVGEPTFGLGAAPRDLGHRLIVLFESALGRLDATEGRLELARVRSHMAADDRLLVGMDLAKDGERLADAYADGADVYGAFARNAMRRSNREVGTDFRTSDWRLVVEAQPDKARVEIRFEARRVVAVDGGRAGGGWDFLPGEPLIAERAHKPTEGQVAAMAMGAGFSVARVWSDKSLGYALFLLAP